MAGEMLALAALQISSSLSQNTKVTFEEAAAMESRGVLFYDPQRSDTDEKSDGWRVIGKQMENQRLEWPAMLHA